MELDEMNVILQIPENAVSVTITATIMIDDKPMKAKKKLDAEAIRTVRQEFLENVEFGDDYNAMFVLSDKGRELADAIEREKFT